MCVEQHETNGTVHSGVRAQLSQDDRVITAQDDRHDPRGDNRLKAVGNLTCRALGVTGGDREVAPVDGGQRGEHIDVERRVIWTQQR